MTKLTNNEANELLFELCDKHYGNAQSVRRAMMDEGLIEVGQELTAAHVERLAQRLIEKGKATKPVTAFNAPVGKAATHNAQPYTRAFAPPTALPSKEPWDWSQWKSAGWGALEQGRVTK
jgi:hypothetical protein